MLCELGPVERVVAVEIRARRFDLLLERGVRHRQIGFARGLEGIADRRWRVLRMNFLEVLHDPLAAPRQSHHVIAILGKRIAPDGAKIELYTDRSEKVRRGINLTSADARRGLGKVIEAYTGENEQTALARQFALRKQEIERGGGSSGGAGGGAGAGDTGSGSGSSGGGAGGGRRRRLLMKNRWRR